MTACASGCTIRGEHLADCDTPDGDDSPDACRGCLPRPAADGSTVCLACAGRLIDALTRTPGLAEHVRSMVPPGSPAPSEAVIKHTKAPEAPAPLNVTAVADVDDLHAALCAWTARTIRESRMVGPLWGGSDVRPASKRRVFGEVAYLDARVVGIRSGNTTPTRRVAIWLLRHREWVLNRDWTPDMVTEVSHLVNVLTARWPIEERVTRLPSRCVGCGQRALTRWPPADVGCPVIIRCDTCGTYITETDYPKHVTDQYEARRRTQAAAFRARTRQETIP